MSQHKEFIFSPNFSAPFPMSFYNINKISSYRQRAINTIDFFILFVEKNELTGRNLGVLLVF
jgi:hypothetical protein